jgi:hypothetical protein
MIQFGKRLRTLILVGLAVMASTLPKAYGQTRTMRMRPNMPMRPSTVNRTTTHPRTPVNSAIHQTTPFTSNRNPRFDPFLARDLRFNQSLGAAAALGLGSLSGGVIGGSGLTAFPVPYPVSSGSSFDYSNPYSSNPGDSSMDVESPALLQEKVRAERLANRRRLFDENLYERERSLSADEERQVSQREQLRRSLHNPPVNEIWSGQALNTLVDDLAHKLGPDSEGQGASIPLDSGVLRHLNLTMREGHGNPGLLKDEGRLRWPPVLREKLYQANRDLIDSLAPVLYAQAVAGRVDPGTLQQMNQTAQQLQRQVTANIRDMTPAQYSEARRFLVDFGDALKLLRRPDAGSFIAANAVHGMTVGKLVNQLVRQGWSFAPAVAGDEGAYVAAHRALVAYDLAVSKASTSQSASK